MRKIKFRAWDKITKQYYAVSGLEYDDDGNLDEVYLAGVQISESNPVWNLRKPSDVVLEQYTGLKDQNDKEIAEGDIVLLANHSRIPYVVVYRECDCSFVAYNEAIIDYVFMFKGMPQCYRVIGNIHENSELLCREKE